MNDNDRKRESDVGNRITNLIRSFGQRREKPIAVEEQRMLAAAAARLDQILKEAADADRQALRNAAVRLDELLGDIRKGKDITDRVSRRRHKS
jgi:flagellar biosynthesis/type III secretory pathway protein FliH